MGRFPRAGAALMTLGVLLIGLLCAGFATWGIAFMAGPLERAQALESRAYTSVHGPLERAGGQWRIEGVDAAAMPADGRELHDLVGEEVIGLVHGGELIALELPEGERVVHGRAGWAPVWTMAALVLLALVGAVVALGLLGGRLTHRLPWWARGALASAPFVLAGVVVGHLRSDQMVKVDVVVVLPLVALVLLACAAGPQWYAAGRALAAQDPLAPQP